MTTTESRLWQAQPATSEMELTAAQHRLRTEHGFWFPGDELNEPLSSPSPEEFRTTFAKSVMPDAEVVSIDGMLSALAVPDRPITGFLLLDFHDTISDLGGSLQLLQYGSVTPVQARRNVHDYGHTGPTRKMFFNDDERQLKAQLYALIHKSEAGLEYMDGLAEIVDTVSTLRERGIYTGFITSVTKGSELSVVENCIGRHFVNNCDFVVIPVIPEGQDYKSIDKGQVTQRIINLFDHTPGTPAVAIDDLPGNTRKFRAGLKEIEPPLIVQTIQPKFNSNLEPDTDSYLARNSVDALQVAQDFLLRNLGSAALR